MYRISFLTLLTVLSLFGCSSSKTLVYLDNSKEKETLKIHEGIICLDSAYRIKYEKEGRSCFDIKLSKPILVAQAEQEEEWGFFQNPTIGKSNDGTLVVSWLMEEDSHKSYGMSSQRKCIPMMSKNKGKTWIPRDKNYFLVSKGFHVFMSDGSKLLVSTPASKDITSYSSFPDAVAKKGKKKYYLEKTLPKDLQGIYLINKNNGSSVDIHAKLVDEGLLRYSIDNLMPIVWWGDIKQLSDGTLLAGVYPGNYIDNEGKISTGGVTFYSSNDMGYTWHVRGRIPYVINDNVPDLRGDRGEFSEPTFTFLPDSTILCVMRSGSTAPMYRVFSSDMGKTWTKPEPFTPNGVNPILLTLDNGVVALVSGRPGIQIRFSTDGKGREWTEPIDLIPFMKPEGGYTRDVSCGYASVIEADKNSFYIVYSDFTTQNDMGDVRKSICFRKVKVKRKK